VTVAELGERELVARIRRRLDAEALAAPTLVIGNGDDAAVVASKRNRQIVLTVDAQVEGVHFERRFSTLEDIGARAVAVNVSDLAAMGATPRWLLLSLVLPASCFVDEVERLVGGVASEARVYGASVVGGNVTSSPGPTIVDITAVGDVRPRRALPRGGGRPGDLLYVSGTVGGAAAGLEMLQAGDRREPISACVARYRRPIARVRLGRAMSDAKAARAAMDLSDGLADAAAQLSEASGCGLELEAGSIPIDAEARDWWNGRQRDPLEAALAGGDDYELLFAVPRNSGGRLRHVAQRVATPGLTRIGRLTKDRGAWLLRGDGRRDPLPRGYEHFREGEGD
jgi:thiamine-monophosphate kinase